jgi:hypothetical protein
MRVVGDYHRDGYAHIQGLLPVEVTRAFMLGLKQDLGDGPVPANRMERVPSILRQSAFEVYGNVYKPMAFFLWALTPTVSQLVGRELLPTYDFFRFYREGDVCRVHTDRPSCEHSLSLTLDYSDGEVWDLELARQSSEPFTFIGDDFRGMEHTAVGMEIGDAVLYNGVHYAHGRTSPNRNAWSAHLFLHYVDRSGQFAEHAFDGQLTPGRVSFSFA